MTGEHELNYTAGLCRWSAHSRVLSPGHLVCRDKQTVQWVCDAEAVEPWLISLPVILAAMCPVGLRAPSVMCWQLEGTPGPDRLKP